MRGRKKKDLPPAKERFVGLRFTEEQYSVLEHNAKAAQLSVSEYIRRSVTGQKIPVFQPIIHRSFMTSMRSWKSSERSIKSAVISIRLQGI